MVQFASIMLYVLVGDGMWGTWLSLARTMTNYRRRQPPDQQETHDRESRDDHGGADDLGRGDRTDHRRTVFRSRSTVAAWLATIGLPLMISGLVITLAVEVPIGNLIENWTEATLPAIWQEIRARWSASHTVRTFLLLAAVAALSAGLTTRTAARDRSHVNAGMPGLEMWPPLSCR